MNCPKCESSNTRKDGNRTLADGSKNQRYVCGNCGYNFSEHVANQELIGENVRLAKEKQKYVDLNRVKDKAFREHARIDNALIEYNAELVRLLEENALPAPKIVESVSYDAKGASIVQLSDLHLNELIIEAFNDFDFYKASKRLKLYAIRTKMYLKVLGIQKILLANTGDTLNSDRRLDEFMNQATNRAKATILSVYLLEQFILDLLQDFELTFAMVTGNESRAKDEYGTTDIVVTDNYDYTIFMMLRIVFRFHGRIKFVMGDPTELVVSIGRQNVLLIHGNQLPNFSGVEKAIQQIVGKHALRGTIIHYVICGHFHSARIGDIYGRSASLAGANTYSDKELQLASRASQNIYIFWNDGNRDGIKVDLQEVGDIEGYSIAKHLEAYHAKSSYKAKEKETIVRIVI